MAFKLGMNFEGNSIEWNLTDSFGNSLPKEEWYVPYYRSNCNKCASKLICNGCGDCGKCK